MNYIYDYVPTLPMNLRQIKAYKTRMIVVDLTASPILQNT